MDEFADKTRLLIEPWIDEGAMQSWRHRADSDILVVCFRSLRLGSTAGNPYEMPRAATGNGRFNALFLTDREESWLNAPGLIEAYAATIAHAIAEDRPRRVLLLGNSMGGHNALVMAGIVRADAVLAIVPQWSADPALVPDDTRWVSQRQRVPHWRIRHVGDHLNPRVPAVILHSGVFPERHQRQPLLSLRGPDHWVMSGMRHNIAQELHAAGLLEGLVAAVAEGNAQAVEATLSPLGARHVVRRRRQG